MQIRNYGVVVGVLLLVTWHPFSVGAEPLLVLNSASAPAGTAHTTPHEVDSQDLGEIRAHLNAIDLNISALAIQAGKTDHTPSYLALISSFFGLLGVAIGGGVAYFTQRKLLSQQQVLADKAANHATALADAKAKQELQLAENRAKIEIGNSFVQWQLKQLSELYGPLRALLQQSNVMYRHMNTVLIKAEPEKFRLCDRVGEDFDNKIFEIYLDGGWTPFRTILHIHEVYGKNYHINDYFDTVVEIGGRIVSVIEKNAGYARPEQSSEILAVFGQYLAHYSVLKQLHSQFKPASGPSLANASNHTLEEQLIAVDESAVFPREILNLVDVGFKEIINDLGTWRTKATF